MPVRRRKYGIDEWDLPDPGTTNPYRKKSVTGPGPKGRVTSVSNEWRCECEDYECVCKRIGWSPRTGRPYTAQKRFKIDKAKKKKYKAAYKKWESRKKPSR